MILGLWIFLAAPARAQDAPPSPGDTMRLYQRLDQWVRAWKIPTDAGGEPEVKGLSAVAVTLRHEGVVVGRGIDTTGGVRSLVLAAGQAMSEANGRLPIERDALFEEHVRAAAARMTISLELAGPMVPITPAEWTDAALELAPGIDGVGARLGGQTAAIFPGAMTAGAMDPGRGLAAAVSKATGDPTLVMRRPGDLAKDVGAVFYRFRTTHLAQPRPGQPPIFLHRGGRFIEMRDLTEAELHRWADGLAQNLIARRWPGVEKYGLQGTYDPVKGTYDGPAAGPAEQCAASLALSRYAAMASWSPDAPSNADGVAAALLADLAARIGPDHSEWDSPLHAALFILAAGEGTGLFPDEQPTTGVFLRCAKSVEGAFSRTEGFDRARVPLGASGLVVWSLQDLGRAGGNVGPEHAIEVLEPLAAAARDAAFRDAGVDGLASTMPWLGWAETCWASPLDGSMDEPIRAAVALREMRALVWKHQLRPEDLPGDQRDLAGGIVFTAAKNPLPSWQSVRPIAFIATMLGDPRLTDAKESPGELARLLASLRFLRQLSAGEAEGYAYANPDRAMWGVRAGLWDQRQPVEATAMTLLTVCETLRSLEALKAGRR